MIIRQAYDKVKSDYTYLEDVRIESGLSEKVFLLCITELAKQGTIELLPGTQLWNDEKVGYKVGNETFYGVQWLSDTPEKESSPTAFEKLFDRLSEITAIMESTDKKTAVGIIKSEFPEFADMTDNTIKTNITSFPFLCRNMETAGGMQSELDTAKEANQGILAELDKSKQENTDLYNELDKIRQELSKNDDMEQELGRVRKENESLKTELDKLRQNLDKGVDMDLMKEIQDLKSRVIAIETTMQENVRQSLDNELDKKVSNQEMPEFVDKWKVVFKDPYWKLYKVINGKLIWIHIGREFNEDKAREKIKEKLAKLDKK